MEVHYLFILLLMDTWISSGVIFFVGGRFRLIFKIYLIVKERESRGGRGRKTEADSPLNADPAVGLDFMTLTS